MMRRRQMRGQAIRHSRYFGQSDLPQATRHAEAIPFGPLMAFFLAFLAMMVGVYAMPKGDIVFVIVEPNASADTVMQVIGRAGGYFVEGARFDWMAVAQSDDPHFTEKLLRAGALLVLNHELAVGCRLGATK